MVLDTLITGLNLSQRWSSVDPCGNNTNYTIQVNCEYATLQVKALLQGALLYNDHPEWMRDDLRQQQLIPTKEPYGSLAEFKLIEHQRPNITNDILQRSGATAIVDWVIVDLRSPTRPDSILTSRSLLIQRNGDVVELDGSKTLRFFNYPPGDYHVSIRHRNHLGVVTRFPVNLDADTRTIDFIEGDNFAANAMFQLTDSSYALWAGNVNSDEKIIYQGPQNDVFDILYQVLSSTNNYMGVANYIYPGYYRSDINLDGKTIYQGPNNERKDLLFEIILRHPANENLTPNFIIYD